MGCGDEPSDREFAFRSKTGKTAIRLWRSEKNCNFTNSLERVTKLKIKWLETGHVFKAWVER